VKNPGMAANNRQQQRQQSFQNRPCRFEKRGFCDPGGGSTPPGSIADVAGRIADHAQKPLRRRGFSRLPARPPTPSFLDPTQKSCRRSLMVRAHGADNS